MRSDQDTIREFFRRLDHRAALVGLKPIDDAPNSTVVWPSQTDDPADTACWLASQYYSVYCNLNPLAAYALESVPLNPGASVRDNMIARRTRLLIDIDAHHSTKELAEAQKDAIKERYGPPLLENDSGNGYALIYPIDYPNDDDAKQRIRIFLEQLKIDFACVDTSVYGAGRLTRIIGTPNRSVIDGSRIPTLLLN
jgi:hypothetical protein